MRLQTIDKAGVPHGFTLMELLITIAITSILLAIAVPSFNSFIVSNRLTTQANDLISALNMARSEAIKRNASTSLCRAASDTATDCAGTAGTWQNWIVLTNAVVTRRGVVSTYGGKVVVRSTLAADRVTFGSDGLARTGGALVNNQTVNVCSTSSTSNNIRAVTLGAGSRLSTASTSGAC